jgi:hypothetical protein
VARNVDGIMAGSFAIRQSKTILADLWRGIAPFLSKVVLVALRALPKLRLKFYNKILDNVVILRTP